MTHEQLNELLQKKLDELGIDYEVQDLGFGMAVELNAEQQAELPLDKQAELDHFRVELQKQVMGDRAAFYMERLEPDDVRVEPGSTDEPRENLRVKLDVSADDLHAVIVLSAIGAHLTSALLAAMSDPEHAREKVAEVADRCGEVITSGFDNPIEAMIAGRKAEGIAGLLEDANKQFALEQFRAELDAGLPDDFAEEA